MFFTARPENFQEDFSIVGTYCVYRGLFLLLKRNPKCFYGDRWCLPGGKLEENESRIDGAIRELKEECGLESSPKTLLSIGTFYLQNESQKYSFTVYSHMLQTRPKISLRLREHTHYEWVPLDAYHRYPLIDGGDEVLKYCLHFQRDFSMTES